MTVNEMIDATKEILRFRGWGQGGQMVVNHTKGTGPVCLGLALKLAYDVNRPRQTWRDLNERLQRALPPQFGGYISIWNDQPDRTVEEVFALLDAVRDPS